MKKRTIYFGKGSTEGVDVSAEVLGGKALGLVQMNADSINVPPGFVIPTTECMPFLRVGKLDKDLKHHIELEVYRIGQQLGRQLGSVESPLLLSCRSGAAVSMPGMLKTVLNIGASRSTIPGLAQLYGSRAAWDAYRKLIGMWAESVCHIDESIFEDAFASYKSQNEILNDVDMTSQDFEILAGHYEMLFEHHAGFDFPQNAWKQLIPAVEAVFHSWNAKKAVDYRKIEKLQHLEGTAVTIMSMVMGNLNDRSGTGVVNTRNNKTGIDELDGEFLLMAQGEDIVAGIRTPVPISQLKVLMPKVYDQLYAWCKQLERTRKNVQDIEFTIEDGVLYFLQTRDAKRNGVAAFKIAYNFVEERLGTREDAVLRLIKPEHVSQMLLPCFSDQTIKGYQNRVIARKGIPASPGAAVGAVVFDNETAVAYAARGTKCILIRKDTSPDDITGMHASGGILTATGGLSCHAALVAVGWGKPCIVGAGEIVIDYITKSFRVGDIVVREGDIISINSTTGEVVLGACELSDPVMTPEYYEVMSWADEFRRMEVRANCETPQDAKIAREFGAQGIGLFRTEHMFYAGDPRSLYLLKKMILSEGDERQACLDQLQPYLRKSFEGTLREMDGLNVTKRLFDPPLHEFAGFVSTNKKQARANTRLKARLAKDLGITTKELNERIKRLHETDPGAGFRGCRIGVMFPEITVTQVKAMCEAVISLRSQGYDPKLEIEVPFVMNDEEYQDQRMLIIKTAESYGLTCPNDFLVGPMIESPSACLEAGRMSTSSQFASFGTNDLSSSTMYVSREDSSRFAALYVEKRIWKYDIFKTATPQVVEMMDIAIQRVRLADRENNTHTHIGVCGEHGGDPNSILEFEKIGMDYVSVSPFRIPVARLACAQATLKVGKIPELQLES